MHARLLLTSLLAVNLAIAPCFGQSPREVPTKKLPADRLDGPPFVTAKAWAILDGKNGKLIAGFNETEPRALASTTKIMTTMLVLKLADADPKVLDEIVTFSQRAANTTGSSAKLRAGEKLPVRELLYGLLLPSGNDAAVALAEHFGGRFQKADSQEKDTVRLFVAEMNDRAKAMGMKDMSFVDPNGLGANKSSARDMGVLAWHAMQNSRFRDYVQTANHQCDVTDADGSKRTVKWENTNKLLGIEGYDGIKTGTTTPAGSCLVASGQHNGDHLIVVILGSTSNDSRYADSRNLFRWAWKTRSDKAGSKTTGHH